MPARRPSPALLVVVLVLALLAPVGVAMATGLIDPTPGQDDEVETADGDRRGGADGASGSARLADDGRRTVGDGPSMSDPVPAGSSTTTAPPSPTTTEPPATTPPTTAAPTTAPPPPPPPPTTSPPPVTAPPATAPAEQVVALANQARADAGCAPLRVDARLRAAAQGHSDDMAANDYFSHDSLDGRSFADRVRAAGYPSPGGENIAQGQRSAASVHDAWMNSAGHRANILNCGFTTIGVGLHQATWTWTQNFGY